MNLAGGAGKFQHRSALWSCPPGSRTPKPGSDGLDIAVSQTGLSAKFGRHQPCVIAGRGFVLLVVEKLPERGFLLRAALSHQEHTLHRERYRSCANQTADAQEDMYFRGARSIVIRQSAA